MENLDGETEKVEYLSLFNEAGADMQVEVKLKGFDGNVDSSQMNAEAITRLIDPKTGHFLCQMRFDDWPFDIVSYHINPKAKKLTITAKPLQA